MPDEIPASVPTASPELQALAGAIGHDVQDLRTAIAAYKSGGKAALLASLPNLVSDVQSTFSAVKTAIPQIKAGYKTTEFWLALGFLLTNTVYMIITGHSFPIDVTVPIAGVIAVYTFVRALAKKPTA